ncbi:B12-binding domain-containing radical SAM protein [Neosynechococcus sphagnicola]|uniref:B12-binding domain-containing radical SAM protein n=1 Tax=Neosynechococcus sphagnicola TaxID=1501145 RepID=UPI000A715B50
MVDDNFIGNKRNVKLFLKELQPWMVAHQYPFSFATEASVDLANDQELMDLMVLCNFGAVFLGIETPDEASLTLTQKFQNTRDSLSGAVNAITRSGLRVMAGFIIGFDGEKPGAGARIVQFVEQTAIPTALFSMLQALPDTALWHRLAREGRLRSKSANINQTTLMNFVPTRPLEEIASEYVEAFDQLYDPKRFLDRAYRHFRILGEATYPKKGKGAKKPINWVTIRALLTICWRQGVLRKTRWQFWFNLWRMGRYNPGGISSYLAVCAQIEHFLEYRQIVRREIEEQVAQFLAAEALTKPLVAAVAEVAAVS